MASEVVPMPAELTVHCVRQLASRLIGEIQAGGALRLDLAAVQRIDTAGIQLLLALRREATRARVPLEFGAPSPAVCELAAFYRQAELLARGRSACAGSAHG